MKIKTILCLAVLALALPVPAPAQVLHRHGFEDTAFVRPSAYEPALRNPMKGLTTNGLLTGSNRHEWATLAHVYLRWNELENSEADGLDRILAVSDQKFAQAQTHNIKIIPRVYLHWDDDRKYWPSDMPSDDYTSAQFRQRVLRLIERLGQAWNNDSRVAFVELGIFGKWGEHHSPSPTSELQALVGAAFAQGFPDKQVSVRHVWSEFQGQAFGEYWDSWAHQQQMWGHGLPIAQLNRDQALYMEKYVGGEVAYAWGDSAIQPGDNPTDSVTDPVHREFIKNSIRWLHCTQLRWIAQYDASNLAARQGAEELHKVMGYRYVIEHAEFSSRVNDGRLRVELGVSNQGSAPFYYRWPLEIALHDPQTRALVWRGHFDQTDIRAWRPGSDWTEPEFEATSGWPGMVVRPGWSSQPQAWAQPPRTYVAAQEFSPSVADGVYVLSIAILDPAGQKPGLRFATGNYWNGGRHPLGLVGIGQSGGGALPAGSAFDDPALDQSLHYDFVRN